MRSASPGSESEEGGCAPHYKLQVLFRTNVPSYDTYSATSDAPIDENALEPTSPITVTEAEPYQRFFAALQHAMFLTAQQVD
jgi:hypothetical protein